MSQQIYTNYLKWKDSVGVKVSLPSGWEPKISNHSANNIMECHFVTEISQIFSNLSIIFKIIFV